jgi:glycogen debranching enzyme
MSIFEEPNKKEQVKGTKSPNEIHGAENERAKIIHESPEEMEKKLAELREKMGEHAPKRENSDLIARMRLAQRYESTPAVLSAEDREKIERTALENESKLEANYKPEFGVFPSSDKNSNFYNQIWSRDFGHAAGNYFAEAEPAALTDSLNTIFKHQKGSGMLPFRTERTFELLKVTPLKFLADPAFKLWSKFTGKKERPVYEGQDFCNAEDTIPAVIIAVGEFYIASPEGKEFVRQHFEQLKKAMAFFEGKTDPSDSLIQTKAANPDWADSLSRPGKLGTINVWYTRALRLMEFMASELGDEEGKKMYREKQKKSTEAVKQNLYNKEEGYFRAQAGDDRIDTAASIFGALYMLTPEEAVQVEETLRKKLRHASGLQNFYPPYPKEQIALPNKIQDLGRGGYHNEYVWPWITCQNIQVKIKIALGHPDDQLRQQYKQEAIDDLADMAKLFQDAGGAYEIFEPDNRKPVKTPLYSAPKNLMGNLAAYQGAYMQLKKLGWI